MSALLQAFRRPKATLAAGRDELHALLQTVIARLFKMLTRRGVLVEEMGQTCLAEPMPTGTRRAP
jgi:hypothetical protein